jgi:hypothetical protein
MTWVHQVLHFSRQTPNISVLIVIEQTDKYNYISHNRHGVIIHLKKLTNVVHFVTSITVEKVGFLLGVPLMTFLCQKFERRPFCHAVTVYVRKNTKVKRPLSSTVFATSLIKIRQVITIWQLIKISQLVQILLVRAHVTTQTHRYNMPVRCFL